MGLREVKKERLKSEIYEAAIEAFRSRGFDQSRVSDIVSALQISEPTFYNYFPTKEAVLDEYALRSVVGYAELLGELAGDSQGRRIDETLHQLMDVLAAVFAADTSFMATVVLRSRLFWGASGALMETELRAYDQLASIFEKAKEAGEIRSDIESRRLAEMFTGSYMLAVANWVTGWWGTPQPAIKTVLDDVADVFLQGALTRA